MTSSTSTASTPSSAPATTAPGKDRRPDYVWLVALAAVLLFFPGVTGFGFWDPHEIRIADAARNMLDGKALWLASPGGKPPGLIWPVAIGFRLFGIGEFGGRVFIVCAAVLGVIATYWIGRKLFTPRAALIASLGLMVAPGYLLSARQLTSFAFPTLAATLAVGGLLLLFAPDDKVKQLDRRIAGVLALVGMAIGIPCVGVMSAVLVPLAVVLAVRSLDDRRARLLLLVVLVGGIATYFGVTGAKTYSWFLGGNPHWPTHNAVWTSQLKQLGFALFPWSAILPVAMAMLARQDDEQRYAAFGVLAWIVVGYGAAAFQVAATVEFIAPIGAALAIACGVYLDKLIDENRPIPVEGFLIGLTALFIGRDFVVSPEEFISAHLPESIRWPGIASRIPQALVAVAALWGGLVGLAIGVPLVSSKAPVESLAQEQQRKSRLFLFLGAGVVSLGLALATAHFIVPEMSKHLSSRDLYSSTRKLNPNAPIAQYKFNASGSSYYSGGQAPKNLASLDDLWKFLAQGERVFVMAGAEELASLDQAARQTNNKYFVIDDSNSRYLVLSNQLGAGESDKNPLRQFVLDAPPTPKFPLSVDLDGKLELIGYDMPTEVQRGHDFKVRLYFKVNQALGGNYKVFLHFDGGGSRFNGDHVPVGGRFPTQNWVAGSYIIDEHTISPDRAQQPTATFQAFMGMFQGDKRLKVLKGDHDGENRVKIGKLIVR